MPNSVITLHRRPGTSEAECLRFAQCLTAELFEGPVRDREKDIERDVAVDPLELWLHDMDAGAATDAVVRAAGKCAGDWDRLYYLAKGGDDAAAVA